MAEKAEKMVAKLPGKNGGGWRTMVENGGKMVDGFPDLGTMGR